MAVKNTIVDLHNMLMEQMERLNDEDLTAEDLERETKRTDSMVKLGRVICDNTTNMIAAQKVMIENGEYVQPQRVLLGNADKE